MPRDPFEELYPEMGWQGLARQSRRVRLPALNAPDSERMLIGAKTSPAYRAHPYPTKVPPEMIESLVTEHSLPGQLILDPFCGSGMTGVGALRQGRIALLSDLSPLATHIAWNMTAPLDVSKTKARVELLVSAVSDEIEQLYESRCCKCDGRATIHWVVWTDTVACRRCSSPHSVWDGARKNKGLPPAELLCTSCGDALKPARSRRVDTSPAEIKVQCDSGCGAEVRSLVSDDWRRMCAIEASPINYWIPEVGLGPDREMYRRNALGSRSIRSVSELYTPRNLRALAALWNGIWQVPDSRERQALALAFTAAAWHGTRMRRYNPRGGHRPLTGTLYIPQLSVEVNVLRVFQKKMKEQLTYHALEPRPTPGISHVATHSATSLPLDDGQIDSVITDPPFGGNIYYADCNIVGEAWLGRLTVQTQEVVMNSRGRKAATGAACAKGNYEQLLTDSLVEISRVLRRDGTAVVFFNNSRHEVWEALQDALAQAGLRVVGTGTADKSQLSPKGYRGWNGRENVPIFDAVLSLSKAPRLPQARKSNGAPEPTVGSRDWTNVHALRALAHSRRHQSDLRQGWRRGVDIPAPGVTED